MRSCRRRIGGGWGRRWRGCRWGSREGVGGVIFILERERGGGGGGGGIYVRERRAFFIVRRVLVWIHQKGDVLYGWISRSGLGRCCILVWYGSITDERVVYIYLLSEGEE